MSQQGLRFTLDVDGLLAMSTAVVSFTLYQNLSTPFTLSVDIASGLPDLTAKNFLEKNATLTVWQGNVVQRRLSGIITGVELGENNNWQMNYHLTISPPALAGRTAPEFPHLSAAGCPGYLRHPA